MLQIFEYNETPIQFEVIDGQVMANATTMCQAFKKRFPDWSRTESAKRYIKAITTKLVLTENQLVIVRNGGDQPGSWIHEKLILNLARWLSVDFELWCDEKLTEISKGEKKQVKVMSTAEMIFESAKLAFEHQQRIERLEEKVDQLIESKQVASAQMKFLPLSEEQVPEENERTQVLRLVNNYCDQTGISQHETWRTLYADLYYKYKIGIRSYKKLPGEKTYLDVADRIGCTGKLKALISNMITAL